MPIFKNKEDEPVTVVVTKYWVVLPNKKKYLVSQEVAEYIETLEEKAWMYNDLNK